MKGKEELPYKRVNPISIEVMEKADIDQLYFDDVSPIHTKIIEDKTYHGHFSVCQKLRDIYMSTDNENIKMDARLAMAMTKRMHDKLKWYGEIVSQLEQKIKEQEVNNGG
jgi:hypothetical protein